jgi:hypothetical protein
MRLPIGQITKFVQSPKGRKMLQDARTKLDTPENRRKVTDTVSRLRSRGQRPAGSAGT